MRTHTIRSVTTRNNRKPTSFDVAKAAGVSQSTVSYVLTGSRHAERFSEETKRRVIEAARLLNYRPDSGGLALKRGYSNTIVLLAVSWQLASSHVHTIMSITRAATRRGLSTIVNVACDDEEATAFLKQLPSVNPYGLLVLWDSSARPVDQLTEIRTGGLPILDLMPQTCESIPSVTMDRAQGFSLAVQRLAADGHSHIGLVYNTTRSTTGDAKLSGYKAGLETAGIPFREALVRTMASFQYDAGRDGIRELLRYAPDVTAVICGGDPITYGLLMEASSLGVRIPSDLSVVGFGYECQVGGEFLTPPLTTLVTKSDDLADHAIEALVLARTDPEVGIDSVLEPMELLRRGSTGPARAGRLSITIP